MNIDRLEKILKDLDQPDYRVKQVKEAIFQKGIADFSQIFSLPKDLRTELEERMKILSFEAEMIQKAKDGNSVKALFRLTDGQAIESVLISPKPGL